MLDPSAQENLDHQQQQSQARGPAQRSRLRCDRIAAGLASEPSQISARQQAHAEQQVRHVTMSRLQSFIVTV
ncbi:hypothetical protein ACTMU2_36415 [Cupriavidus basilensis]